MIELFDNDTGVPVGHITDAQLQFLIDQLEEESADDTDYYISRDTLDVFEEQGADPAPCFAARSAPATTWRSAGRRGRAATRGWIRKQQSREP